MTEKPRIPFERVSRAIHETAFPASGAVVGILRGARVPASLIAHQLGLPLFWLHMRFRDDAHNPMSAEPALIGGVPDLRSVQGGILLVDDVSVTGSTFNQARSFLGLREITTVALKGHADIVLLPELDAGCVRWPWSDDDG